MPESPYWKQVKNGAKMLAECFGDGDFCIGRRTVIANNVAWENEFGMVKADLSSYDCGALSVGFIFSNRVVPDDFDCLEIVEKEGVVWQVRGKGIKKIVTLKSDNLQTIRLEFSWDSGNPNTDFYGMITFIKVWFSDFNEMVVPYPWLLEKKTLPILDKMISGTFALYGVEPISIVEKIDFDRKIEEVLRKSKIFDLL